MEEIDIWRTAKILIDAHGDQAETHAAMRADKALEDGYPDVVNVWKRVMAAVQALQRQQPSANEPLN